MFKLRNSPFFLILLIGFALRLFQAFHTIEVLHPDEHFQVLEPAAHAAWGIGWMTWEWDQGLRSWITPGIFVPWLRLLELFGQRGGSSSIYFCRTLISLLSSGFVFSFWILLKKRKLSDLTQWLLLSVVALEPAWIRLGPATLSDTLAMDSLWLAMPLITAFSVSQNPKKEWTAGLLLGIPFLFRIQTALFAAGFLAPFLLQGLFRNRRTSPKNPITPMNLRRSVSVQPWMILGLGYLTAVMFQGAVDSLTWGKFLGSVLTNVKINLLEHTASFYGIEPSFYYFTLAPRAYGWGFSSLIVLAALVRTRLPKLNLVDLSILSGSLFYLGIHVWIPHKEPRFLFPILPGLLYISGVILDQAVRRLKTFFSNSLISLNSKIRSWPFLKTSHLTQPLLTHPTTLKAFLMTLTLFTSVWTYSRITDWRSYPESNMSNLMLRIAEDGLLKQAANKCLLLLGHYWSWTHGEFLQGHRYQYIEASTSTVSPRDLFRCPYVVVLPQQEALFLHQAKDHYQLLDRNPRGYALYRRH